MLLCQPIRRVNTIDNPHTMSLSHSADHGIEYGILIVSMTSHGLVISPSSNGLRYSSQHAAETRVLLFLCVSDIVDNYL